jgi:proline-specific peptidase
MSFDRRSLLKLGGGAAALLAAPRLLAQGYPEPTREAMLPVPGGKVYVRVNGDLAGPRPPLVIAHGGPGGTHSSYLDATSLAGDRAIILYDQLDSGRSEHPGDPKNWRVGRFVDELEAIRTGLGVKRWHVCGHSWGGTIALEYGARRPAALAGLVLASPLISTRSWLADANALIEQLPPDIARTLDRCKTLADPEGAPGCDAATDAFYAAFNGRERASPAMIDYLRSHPGPGFNPVIYRAMWGNSEFVSTGSLSSYDGEPLLAKLDGQRTLFVGGQYDEARPSTLAGFAARVPGAEFATVPGAAHGIFTDRTIETLAILRGWMARHDAI